LHYLGSADTNSDFQCLRAGYLLTERSVEAGAGLLNKPKVKSRCVGDCLEVVGCGGEEISVGYGNCRMLPNIQTLDRLLSEDGT
jgi:hypothetical protein